MTQTPTERRLIVQLNDTKQKLEVCERMNVWKDKEFKNFVNREEIYTSRIKKLSKENLGMKRRLKEL